MFYLFDFVGLYFVVTCLLHLFCYNVNYWFVSYVKIRMYRDMCSVPELTLTSLGTALHFFFTKKKSQKHKNKILKILKLQKKSKTEKLKNKLPNSPNVFYNGLFSTHINFKKFVLVLNLYNYVIFALLIFIFLF